MTQDCHQHTAEKKRDSRSVDVVLVGNPNSGKTTIFNALTGLRQKVGNYPGVTVEQKMGFFLDKRGENISVQDLPGLYSLIPKSLDEKIAIDILLGQIKAIERPKLIVVVADASNLSRNLYLATQILELDIPAVIALNMVDTAKSKGLNIDVNKLSKKLSVPVIPVIGKEKVGIQELKNMISEYLAQTDSQTSSAAIAIPGSFAKALQPVSQWLRQNYHLNEKLSATEAYRIISNDKALTTWLDRTNGYAGLKENLSDAVTEGRASLSAQNISWEMNETKQRYDWIDKICKETVSQTQILNNFGEKLDVVLTHKIAGPLIFITLFAFIFQAIFSWAEIPMNAIENGISLFGSLMARLLPDGIFQDLIVEGAIAGVGAILVFLPQIMFLFFFLSLLEDTGYMARVAFICDRFMRGLGLSGRSVIPLLSSFACAIPGIMATRTIRNSRDRLITIMIAPLMSCSARLPVYALMIGAFIPGISILGIFSLPGLTLLSMYLLGIFAAIGAAFVFKKFSTANQPKSTFVMELPPYRLPSLKWTSLQMWERAKIFITDAGKIIFAMSILMWFLAYFPRAENANQSDNPAAAIKHSYAGKLGHVIEPVIKPLGFDWKMGVGLITSFAAREVMVSTMATIYNVEGADETSVSLREALKKDRDPETGKPIYTPLTAISLMVFFVLACQCMSTVAVTKRETNSWRWPIIMVVYMTTLAYIGSLIVFQGGKFLGLG